MSDNDLFAIAAHLHVLLRRKTGRVTDTVWMTVNAEYAREVVRYAREKARTDGHTELLPLADKMEEALAKRAPAPRRTLLEVAADSLKAVPPTPPPAPDDPGHQYVGGIR